MSYVLCNRPQRVRPYITSNGRLKTDYGNGELKIQHNDFKWFLVVNAYTPRSTSLPGNLVLMVEQGSDIGNPAYGQLQKLHKVDART